MPVSLSRRPYSVNAGLLYGFFSCSPLPVDFGEEDEVDEVFDGINHSRDVSIILYPNFETSQGGWNIYPDGLRGMGSGLFVEFCGAPYD